MREDKVVKDIMASIKEYNTINEDDHLCLALLILKDNYEKIAAGTEEKLHKTLVVTGTAGKIVGKLSIFDILRGLVPEAAKHPVSMRAFYNSLSSRVLEAMHETDEINERFEWLHNRFSDLVKKECAKQVKSVMSPIHPVLHEDDPINKAIYVMFRENIRQPMVVREGKIVGIVNIMDILPVLLTIADTDIKGSA